MFVLRSIIFALLVSVLFASCSKSDAVPAYVYIPDIRVATNYGTQGSGSDNITDAWLYTEYDIQGVYQLPCLVPVLAEGPTKLTIAGGIMLNGISNTRAVYPYYADTTLEVELVPTETDTIYPVIGYKNATQFLFKEDFENGNDFESLERSDVSPFEGNYSGRVVPNSDRFITVETINFYDIDNYIATVFVELDYKSSHIMTAGLEVESSEGVVNVFKLDITPKDEWSKIYINFTPEINNTLATSVKLFFDVNATGDSEPIEVYLDNVKLLYL